MKTVRIEKDFAGLDRLAANLRGNAEAIVEMTASRIQANAQDSMVGGGRPHVPSAPGQPPHRDTGALANSIHVSNPGIAMTRDVGDGVEYGIHLEYGTVNMAARPWLRPAVEKESANFEKAWEQLLR